MKNKLPALFTLSLVSLMACDSGGGSSNSNSTVDLGISASSNADKGSSYTQSKADVHTGYSSLGVQLNNGELMDAIAYLDADGDGDTDVFMATGSYLLEGEIDSQMLLNDGGDNFAMDNSYFNGNPPPATHARKTLAADFNGDGLMDLFVLDHGYDADPFPGNYPKLIMQDSTASFSWEKLKAQKGFHHGGSAGDIDNDGDIDVFVGGHDPFFFINDGKGAFEKVDNRLNLSQNKVFSAELIDVDKDGFLDLLVGAHEQDGDDVTIYWGNTTGAYTTAKQTKLPAVSGYGTVLDFEAEDLNNDGRRDVVVNRTGGGNSNFYQGVSVQVLSQEQKRDFQDVTSAWVDDSGKASDGWFPWLRAQDIDGDGDIDIFSDDKDDGFLLDNDGSAQFVRKTF